MDTSPGWTTGTGWAFGKPAGGGGAYGFADPMSGHTGTNVYGYNLGGDYANNIATTRWLTAGPFNLGGVTSTRLGFWRWLGVEQPEYDIKKGLRSERRTLQAFVIVAGTLIILWFLRRLS